MEPEITSISQHHIAELLTTRPSDSHKGMFGTVAIIGGSSGMVGAALLTGRAALKMGSGLVYVGLLSDVPLAVDSAQPELMLHTAPDALHIPNISVLAVGCGMADDPTAQHTLLEAIQHPAPLVLDAGALNLIAHYFGLRRRLAMRKHPTLLTPHPGEAARLLNCSTAEVQANRPGAATQLAKTYACPVVLKGANTLCATKDGTLFMNHTGNPGMSGPGMGDVLTGMVASFIGQGLKIEDAMLLAVYLHGAAGDELAKQHITVGMTATELINQARELLNQWTAMKSRSVALSALLEQPDNE
ncbi:MAG: NAD(P)H-hydrate dehydratase [Gallionella sp.]|nr:NAD(P)H-hydrate dehydratase [Gallionella sp.]MDD4946079.1 NAD(P)H-hydrate dehydratase [Gallionella sp.]